MMLSLLHSSNLQQRGGDKIELSLIEAVVASVVAYYICKWLDDNFFSDDN